MRVGTDVGHSEDASFPRTLAPVAILELNPETTTKVEDSDDVAPVAVVELFTL